MRLTQHFTVCQPTPQVASDCSIRWRVKQIYIFTPPWRTLLHRRNLFQWQSKASALLTVCHTSCPLQTSLIWYSSFSVLHPSGTTLSSHTILLISNNQFKTLSGMESRHLFNLPNRKNNIIPLKKNLLDQEVFVVYHYQPCLSLHLMGLDWPG